MGSYNLLINRVYWDYNPLTNLLLTSWDILVLCLKAGLDKGWVMIFFGPGPMLSSQKGTKASKNHRCK